MMAFDDRELIRPRMRGSTLFESTIEPLKSSSLASSSSLEKLRKMPMPKAPPSSLDRCRWALYAAVARALSLLARRA